MADTEVDREYRSGELKSCRKAGSKLLRERWSVEFDCIFVRIDTRDMIGNIGTLIILNINRRADTKVVSHMIKRVDVKSQDTKPAINFI